MTPERLLDTLHTAERLKDVTRHSYTSGGRHESVAEHSWRLALMAFFLDNMEAVLQHNEAPLSTWEPNEYQLNLTYGQEKAAFSPVLSALRQALREETLRKLEARPD